MNENNRYREEELEEPVEEEQVVEEEKNESSTEEKKETEPKNKKLKKLQERIKELEEQELFLKNEMLKDRAELENFKRRMNEERIKERKYANQEFFLELINILDVFDKAVNVNTDDPKLKNYLIGFSMVNVQLGQTLERYGVKKIESLGKAFDPSFHSAVETIETDDTEPGIVIEEVMTGYLYKDRVLRPSMVKVSAKKEN